MDIVILDNINNIALILEKLPSQFYLAIFSTEMGIAAIGSFFGAVGGYFMVMVTDQRSRVLSQIANYKTALATTHVIFNTFLSLKKQHFKVACEKYEEDRLHFVEVAEGRIVPPNNVLSIQFNFATYAVPYVDYDLLRSQIFDKPQINGRSLVLAMQMMRALKNLQDMIQAREQIVSEINSISLKQGLTQLQVAHLYFGVRLSDLNNNGTSYEKYSGVMEAIKLYTNDGLWFSKALMLEIKDIANKSRKKVYFGRPKQVTLSFSDVDEGLLPSDEEYKDFIEKFK